MKTLYTAKATATGGRKGHVKTEDGPIDMPLSMPKGLGGDGGDGVNPELLFGSAYSACFGSALSLVAEKHKVDLGDFSVTAHISINQEEDGNLLLSAVLDSYLPGVSEIETAETLVNEAHVVCPFSRATRDNIDVTLNILRDE
ncbi:Ohr family peroxiredoxin [Psychroflexus curvus]|uniref:Ohr family peroxiredoxin n=1 Tax=Psychroflexus curvus TaxID=2873595 RepID=UPI0021D41326|nr:Ohr family peroxiredoxin [Psychroflexus curvus]